MTIEDIFEESFKQWIAHCESLNVQVSSNPRTATECEAYKKIMTLGTKALPLIRQAYNSRMPRNTIELLALEIITTGGIPMLIHDIIGKEFDIPKEISGNMTSIEEYTKQWLDEYVKTMER